MREDLTAMSDDEIMRSLEELVLDQREDLIRVLRRLAELDRRRAADKKGYPSLFDYCMKRLHYSEGETMRRINSARAASRFPVIYRLIGNGMLSLTNAAMLEPHLKKGNCRALLRRAVGRSTREVKALVDSLKPETAPVDRVRHLGPATEPAPAAVAGPAQAEDLFSGSIPAPTPAPSEQAEAAPAPTRVHFSFAAGEALLRGVERAKELLRHKYPFARLEDVFAEALEALLDDIDPERRLERKAARARPAPASGGGRRIPQAVKDEVWRRDGGACAYEGEAGRCGARSFLEYDHVVPWALGGRSDDPSNIRLLCRAHNQMEARRVFGDAMVDAAARGEDAGGAA